MQWVEREELEREIQELCRRNEHGQAIERALQGYGSQLQRLVMSVLHDHDLAMDAYSRFCENLMKGLPGFLWQCSFQAWACRLARNTCYQVRHTPAARREQVRSPSHFSEMAHRPRTETNPWQRSSVKGRFQLLRARLSSQERMLLRLRVDQGLPWPEVARAIAGAEKSLTGEQLHRKAAALRQQFVSVKVRLRQLALEEGLIDPEDPPNRS